MMKARVIAPVVLVIIITLIVLTHRESISRDEVITLKNGKTVSMKHTFSGNRVYVEFGHAGRIGGGNYKFETSFEIDGKDYYWSSDEGEIFIINFDSSGTLFVATFYNVYNYDGKGWIKLPIEQIDYSKAVRNVWKSGCFSCFTAHTLAEKEVTERLDIENEFKLLLGSITTNLWEKLICSSAEGDELKNCLIKFKNDYINVPQQIEVISK